MLDRVREALFATLQPWIEGAFVLDLFAGSGALGIEALSRGARRARFVERAAHACECLAANVTALGLDDAVELVRRHLAPEGVLVFHAPHRLDTPGEFASDLVVRERVYGSNSLWYLQREEPGPGVIGAGER